MKVYGYPFSPNLAPFAQGDKVYEFASLSACLDAMTSPQYHFPEIPCFLEPAYKPTHTPGDPRYASSPIPQAGFYL